MPVRHYGDKNCVTRSYATVPSPPNISDTRIQTRTRIHQHTLTHDPRTPAAQQSSCRRAFLPRMSSLTVYICISHVSRCDYLFAVFWLVRFNWSFLVALIRRGRMKEKRSRVRTHTHAHTPLPPTVHTRRRAHAHAHTHTHSGRHTNVDRHVHMLLE